MITKVLNNFDIINKDNHYIRAIDLSRTRDREVETVEVEVDFNVKEEEEDNNNDNDDDDDDEKSFLLFKNNPKQSSLFNKSKSKQMSNQSDKNKQQQQKGNDQEGFKIKKEITYRNLINDDIAELKVLCAEWFPVT
jgi:hypothetical protein